MKDRVLVEIGKIKGNLRELWDCTKAEDLERNKCLNIIHEIDKSLNNIVNLWKIIVTQRLTEVEPERLLIAEGITKAFGGKTILDSLAQGLSTVERMLLPSSLSSLIHSLENPQYYDEKSVKTSIRGFCKELEMKIVIIEDELGKNSELLLLAEFTSLFPSFTQNWSVATVYLTAMEISVKKKLAGKGEKVKDTFKENFRQLIACLKEDKIEISELEKALPSLFWDIRNKVIHEGYSPTDEELKLIREYIVKLLEKLDLQ